MVVQVCEENERSFHLLQQGDRRRVQMTNYYQKGLDMNIFPFSMYS